MMAYASNFNTQEPEAGGLLWFESSLKYILNSRQALTTKRDLVNPVLQRGKKNKKEKEKTMVNPYQVPRRWYIPSTNFSKSYFKMAWH